MNTNHQKNIMKFNKTIITYSWSKEPEISHRISGHLFEAIDYFLDNRNIKILLPEINELRNALKMQNVVDVKGKKYSYQASVTYMDLIIECEKLGDYIINVEEAVKDSTTLTKKI